MSQRAQVLARAPLPPLPLPPPPPPSPPPLPPPPFERQASSAATTRPRVDDAFACAIALSSPSPPPPLMSQQPAAASLSARAIASSARILVVRATREKPPFYLDAHKNFAPSARSQAFETQQKFFIDTFIEKLTLAYCQSSAYKRLKKRKTQNNLQHSRALNVKT